MCAADIDGAYDKTGLISVLVPVRVHVTRFFIAPGISARSGHVAHLVIDGPGLQGSQTCNLKQQKCYLMF